MNIVFQCLMTLSILTSFIMNSYLTYLFLNLAIERNPYIIISDENMIAIDNYMNNYYEMFKKMNTIENQVCELLEDEHKQCLAVTEYIK